MLKLGTPRPPRIPSTAPYNSALHVYSKIFTKKSSGPRCFLTPLDPRSAHSTRPPPRNGADYPQSLARILEAEHSPVWQPQFELERHLRAACCTPSACRSTRISLMKLQEWRRYESFFSRIAGLKSRRWIDVGSRRRASLEAWKMLRLALTVDTINLHALSCTPPHQ